MNRFQMKKEHLVGVKSEAVKSFTWREKWRSSIVDVLMPNVKKEIAGIYIG
jgi:hypothetical protein